MKTVFVAGKPNYNVWSTQSENKR